MRDIDRLECAAMGRTPKQALRAGLMVSEMCWTAKVEGRAEAMFGRVTESALGGDATVWFLGTDAVYSHGRAMLKMGRSIIDSMGDSRLTLRNLVSVRNDRAIRLLRKWGFTINPEEVDVRGMPFLRFERTFS